MKIILSGKPGVGKSTILEKVIDQLKAQDIKILGCIVKEMQASQGRSGFKIHYIPSKKETTLASCEKKLSDQYISKFSVNIDAIENELIPFMNRMCSAKSYDLLIFDEIGRMQNLSPHFLKAVDTLMTVKYPLIATVVYDYEAWARKYKNDQENFLTVVTESNRDFMPSLITTMLLSAEYILRLSDKALSGVLALFRKYIQNEKFLELNKLFNKTVKYIANNNFKYDTTTNSYCVRGDHDLREVSWNSQSGYACVCPFHRGLENSTNTNSITRECSHIQTVSIVESYRPRFEKSWKLS